MSLRGKVLPFTNLNNGVNQFGTGVSGYGAGSEAERIVDRATRIVGAKIHYHLEYPNGGADPGANTPADRETLGCDCIGFAAWAAGFDRYQPKKFPYYDGYINTDSMVFEARSKSFKGDDGKQHLGGQWFTVLDKPEPGCFIVAESYRKPLALKRTIGHIGVVTDCSEHPTKGLAGIHVVHCSPSNVKRPGNKGGSAVWKTDGTVWAGYPKVYFIRFNREYALSAGL